jgi:hypothetical protein
LAVPGDMSFPGPITSATGSGVPGRFSNRLASPVVRWLRARMPNPRNGRWAVACRLGSEGPMKVVVLRPLRALRCSASPRPHLRLKQGIAGTCHRIGFRSCRSRPHPMLFSRSCTSSASLKTRA